MISNKTGLATTSPTRFHPLDALRSFAMLLGPVVHLSLTYAHKQIPFWKLQDAYQSYFFDIILVLLRSFRLEIFFLLSGFFATFMYQKKGGFYFIKNRFIRIFVPLMIGWPIIVLLFIFLQPTSALNSITPHAAINLNPTMPDLTIALWDIPPFHLWFLYYLLLLYGVFTMIVLFTHLTKIHWKFLDTGFLKILESPYHIWILALTTLPLVFLMKSLWIDVPLTLALKGRVLIYYGVFFAFGCFLNRQPQILLRLAKNRWLYLKIAIPAALCLAPTLAIVGIYASSVSTLTTIIIRIMYVTCTWSLVLCMIGFSQHYFTKENKTIRYLSDASYWVYLMHLPLLVYFQKLLMDSSIPGPLKPLVVLSLTFGILFISYHYAVRYSLIGTLLNGKRSKAHPMVNKDDNRMELSSNLQ